MHLLYLYRDFVKALGFTHVRILGVGEGGGLAVAFGHHFPEITGAVISINGFESVNWTEGFGGTLSYFSQSASGGLGMLLSTGSIRYRKKSPSREEMDRWLVPLPDEERKKAVQARFEALIQDVKEGFILAMLPNFDRPLLLLRGESDDLLPDGEKYVKRTQSQIRKHPVEYDVVSEAGHFAFLDQPERVAERIRAFLAKNAVSK